MLCQPSINHFLLKAPLPAHFEGGNFLLPDQAIDGKPVDIQVTGDFLNRKQF
jgi:hypothetical protein